jgi:hypothetical protein
MVGRTTGAPYDARYTISEIRMPLDRIPLCLRSLCGPGRLSAIRYPLSPIPYPLSPIAFSLLQLIIPSESVASDEGTRGGWAPASSRVGLRALVVLQPSFSDRVDPLPCRVQFVAPHE